MSPIKAGDLVLVTRGWSCCGYTAAMGYPFTVKKVTRELPGDVCNACGAPYVGLLAWATPSAACPVSRLTKIDPPATGDSLPTRRELNAPATA